MEDIIRVSESVNGVSDEELSVFWIIYWMVPENPEEGFAASAGLYTDAFRAGK